jgi:tRNA (guanine-N7-)-methyltransferase
MSGTNDRGIKTYVLRAGRMTDAQKRSIAELWPRYGVAYEAGAELDMAKVFGNDKPTVAEIGFGMGQATWQIAQANPDVNYLGLEVHTPGVGRLMTDLDSKDIPNVRIVRHDAIEVFEGSIKPGSFSGLHIFYPDPWPKKRHHKRRLIRDGLSGILSSRLAIGGYLYFVTDIEDYALWSLDVLSRTPFLRNRYERFAPRQEWRPETKFEARAAKDGRGAWELLFERI